MERRICLLVGHVQGEHGLEGLVGAQGFEQGFGDLALSVG